MPSPIKHSVLVVEDDTSARRFLVYALQHLGFHVSEAGDVQSAASFLDRVAPQLVLADCNLPQTSGTDLVRWAHHTGRSMHVIGMSAEHFKGKEMLEAGAVDFIPKPIDFTSLKETLEKHAITVGQDEPKRETIDCIAPIGTRAHPTNAPRVWMRNATRKPGTPSPPQS